MRTIWFAAAVALATATPAIAEVWDLVLTNASGREIKMVEASPSGAATWQKNIVDEEVRKAANIRPGGRATVHFDKVGSQCRYDLKATFVDDTTAVWSNINVCDNAFVVVKYAASGAPVYTAN